MHWLPDLALSFVLLGLMEALVKPIARRFVQRRLLAVAPLLFAWLDPLLPDLLQHGSGAELEQVVRQKLESLTGERWSRGELEALFTLFDPRAAADNALSALSDEAFSLWLQETPPEELERWRP